MSLLYITHPISHVALPSLVRTDRQTDECNGLLEGWHNKCPDGLLTLAIVSQAGRRLFQR